MTTVLRKSDRVLPVTKAATPHRKRADVVSNTTRTKVTFDAHWVLRPIRAMMMAVTVYEIFAQL